MLGDMMRKARPDNAFSNLWASSQHYAPNFWYPYLKGAGSYKLSLWLLQQERKAAVIRAEGESESAKLISEATKAAGGGMLELRRIEAARDIASTMSRSGNVVYLPSGNNMLLGINSGTTGR